MDIQKEREAFEAIFNHLDLSYVDNLGYCEYETQVAWQAWQAAKAQSVPEWISVEDELPPTDTMVLICWSDSPDVEPEKDFMDICTDTGCPFWANYLNEPPTHWMPLPRVIVAQEPK